MDIPENITWRLEQLDISYCIEDIDADLLAYSLTQAPQQNARMVHATFLQVGQDHVMAMFGEDSLCIPDQIGEHLGKKIRPATTDFEDHFLEAKGLQCLLAIPQLVDYQVVVDQRLLEVPQLYLYSGTHNRFIVLDAAQFEKLTADSLRIPFTVPLLEIKQQMTHPEQDMEGLHAAIRKYTRLSIQKRLTDTLGIPPLSTTARQIIKLNASSNASADQLIALVRLEPSLAAQVVSWAASPYYSAPGTVSSIKDAVVRVLGYDLVMNLAIGLVMGKLLDVPREYPGGITNFWRQSVYCALLMEKLNRHLPKDRHGKPGLAYLAGLLNNFGYIVLAHVFPTYFLPLSHSLQSNRHVSHIYVEHYLLGVCREQISSQLLQAWGVPEEVTVALRYQSDETYVGEHHLYANLCLVSKGLLAARGMGENTAEFIPARIYQQLGLQPMDAEMALQELFESADQIDAMISIFPS